MQKRTFLFLPEQVVLGDHGEENGYPAKDGVHRQIEPLGAAQAGEEVTGVEQGNGEDLEERVLEKWD